MTLSLLFLLGCSAQPYQAETGSEVEINATGKWSPIVEDNLPNVLILGDSISIGYTLKVRELLTGQANVFRPNINNGQKAENCQGTEFGVGQITRWIGDKKWDVIHFNWGLHDLKHVQPDSRKNSNNFNHPRQAEPQIYRTNLVKIVEQLQTTGAKLVFATTTPYPDGVKPARAPIDALVYNDIALQLMIEKGIQINDLYALSENKLEQIQLPKNVHFNEQGRKLQAAQVAKVIQPLL